MYEQIALSKLEVVHFFEYNDQAIKTNFLLHNGFIGISVVTILFVFVFFY